MILCPLDAYAPLVGQACCATNLELSHPAPSTPTTARMALRVSAEQTRITSVSALWARPASSVAKVSILPEFVVENKAGGGRDSGSRGMRERGKEDLSVCRIDVAAYDRSFRKLFSNC